MRERGGKRDMGGGRASKRVKYLIARLSNLYEL